MREQEELITVELCDRCGIVIGGELDVLTAPILHEVASELSAVDEHAMNVDLSDITFIDASGVRALLCLKHTLPYLRVVAVSERVAKVLEITQTYDALVDPALPATG